MTEIARVHLIISGRVQGVNFRYSTMRTAESLGLSGWVRNRSDGTVEAVGEGPRDKLEEFVAWCRQGPPAASVSGVKAEWQNAQGKERGFRYLPTE